MVALVLGAGALGLLLAYFGITTVSTLASSVAVGGSLLLVATLVYTLIEEEYLEFLDLDTSLAEILIAGAVSGLAGLVSYRIIEALLATAGFLIASIVTIIIIASIFTSPILVGQVLAGLVRGIADLFGGE